MPWLRSRRFYAGILIGLVPLLLMMVVATAQPGDRATNDSRVLVRNYNECISDSLAHERTLRLLEMLPEDGVLVENFFSCCCCCGEEKRKRQMERSGVQTSWKTPPGVATPPSAADIAPGAPAPPAADPLSSLQPRSSDHHVASPGGLPQAAVSRSGLTPWLFLATLPLIRFTGLFDNDKEFPPGVICPDSGVTTGPERPRC